MKVLSTTTIAAVKRGEKKRREFETKKIDHKNIQKKFLDIALIL